MPDHAAALSGDLHGVLLTAVGAVADDAPAKAESALRAVMRLEPAADAPAPLVRRVSALRCAAAAKLARGAWDSDVLRSCDLGDGEAGEQARLAALDRGPLAHARRAPWLELTRSKHVRVREAALDAITRHPELGDAALPVLAEALASGQAGVVASAADVVHAHPDRCFVLAASEKRAALDPRAPPPPLHPARELDAGIARAMRAALAHPWTPDLVEARVALLDAALALQLDEGKPYAQAACRDAERDGPAARRQGARGRGRQGRDVPGARRRPAIRRRSSRRRSRTRRAWPSTPTRARSASASIPRSRPSRPRASSRSRRAASTRACPSIASSRASSRSSAIAAADGYGGSGRLAPVRDVARARSRALDVGVALAGRDTGSSQIFVTLARHPHLDGEYAWVGHADGDWDGVAEGDVIRGVHVEE